MRLEIFKSNDSVLLLGEGNFSFSVDLIKHNLNLNIIATCYESEVIQEAKKKNIEYLENNDVRVILGVDATNLASNPILRFQLFDKIIFNFPHIGGKMKIEQNRQLLKQFFISAKDFLNPNGSILITLCNGQGGTSMDNPQRCYNDSWKIVEMSAYGSFFLVSVEPFCWYLYKDYIVTGYRGLNKSFNAQKALTHIFKKSDFPNEHNIGPALKINLQSIADLTWKEIMSQNYEKSMLKKCIYPVAFTFDLTLYMVKNLETNKLYETFYNCAGLVIDDIKLFRSYIFPDDNKIANTYRITYKSYYVPLNRKIVINIHENLIPRILTNQIDVWITR